MYSKLFAAVLGLATIGLAGEARAQFVTNGPDGSIGIQNGNGGYDYYYPGRMSIWANIRVPGSTIMTPDGPIWRGLDGKIHGDLTDPNTGDVHFRMARPSVSSANAKQSQPATVRPFPRPVGPTHRGVAGQVQNGPNNHRPPVHFNRTSPRTTTWPTHRSR